MINESGSNIEDDIENVQNRDNKDDSGTGTVARPYDDHMNASNVEAESSNFMAYFFALTIFTMCGYLIFYNKKKVNCLNILCPYLLNILVQQAFSTANDIIAFF